ncbi:MAG: sugar phosphate isomerase/epimerase [Limisphaerales bacterium]
MQLYSLRNQLATNVPGTLAEIKSWGVTNVELAGTYNLSSGQFKAQLDAQGLNASSGHFPYDRLRTDVEGVARDAKILGLQYVGCAWIPHDGDFNEKTCREAIAVFNKAGEALAKHGLKFFYHVHGYEFQPYENSTLLDLIMRETNPKFVNFQMDVFLDRASGPGSVKLLENTASVGSSCTSGNARQHTDRSAHRSHDVTNDVAVGTGKIAYAPVLREAEKLGVKWYVIEDESPSSEAADSAEPALS